MIDPKVVYDLFRIYRGSYSFPVNKRSIIYTIPKSGTNWLRFLISNYLHCDLFDSSTVSYDQLTSFVPEYRPYYSYFTKQSRISFLHTNDRD